MPFLTQDITDPAQINPYKSYDVAYFSKLRGFIQFLLVKCILNPYLWLQYRPIVKGQENLNAIQPPYLLVSNHTSMLDIILVTYAAGQWGRSYAFMAKKELYKNRLAAAFFRNQGCFAVDREQPDRMTLKTALNVLRSKNGWSLAMFPEGTRSLDGNLLPFKPGFAGLAQKTGVPILPIAIWHDETKKIYIAFGKPVLNTQDAEAAGNATFETIRSLIPNHP